MGQATNSCLSNSSIQKASSIRNDLHEQKKSKMHPLFYINPIKYTKDDIVTMKETEHNILKEKVCSENVSLEEELCEEDEDLASISDEVREPTINVQKIKVKWDHFIKMKTRKFTDDYRIINEIGKGGFGCVYRVVMKNGNIMRAAKKINKNKLKEEELQSLLAEMAIMKKLDHPNITKLYEVYDQKSFYVMVMELCEGGELFEKIVNKSIKENEAKSIMSQVLSALYYLHNLGIVHRDIKPENMLFEKKTKLIKIIDFGISSYIKKGKFLTARVGTPYYIAPEVLFKHYDTKSDLWSLGVVLYMIIYNSPPFCGSEPNEVMKNVLKTQITFASPLPHGFSQQSLSFLSLLLQKDPTRRPSAEEALKHEWLKINKKNSQETKIEDKALERITLFHFKNKLQAVVHTYIVSQLLTSEERMELLGLFRSIDKDGNGIIDADEIKNILKSKKFANVDDTQIMKIIDFVDTNNSGKIDYTEFLVAAIDFDKVNEKHFQHAFTYFDIDNSGEITFEEVAEFLSGEDQQELEKMFKEFDKNGDGIISKSQFVELLLEQKKASLKKI